MTFTRWPLHHVLVALSRPLRLLETVGISWIFKCEIWIERVRGVKVPSIWCYCAFLGSVALVMPFSFLHDLFFQREMLDFMFTWDEDVSRVMCWVFCLHLYSPLLKWIIVGLEGVSFTGRLLACSLSFLVSFILLSCIFFCCTYFWPFSSHLQLL